MLKDKKHLGIIIAISVLVVVIILGIAYAAFSQTLNINGSAVNRNSKWKVYFSRLSNVSLTGTAQEVTAPTIQNDTTIGTYSVSVASPGDSISYEFDVTNDGDYDATLTTLVKNSPRCSVNNDTSDSSAQNVCGQLSYTLTYKTGGATVSQNDTLLSKETKTMVLTLTYTSFDSASLLPTSNVDIDNLGITLTYTQNGNAKVNADGTTPYVAPQPVYAVGDRIQIEGDTSGDYYRVIAASGSNQDYVVALKENPLTNQEIVSAGGTTNGSGKMSYGSTTAYATSDIKSVVDAWVSSKFTNSELETVDGYSARLITFEEAHNLGYDDNISTFAGGSHAYYSVTNSVPVWLWDSNYSYGTMNAYNNSSSVLWYVYETGELKTDSITSSYMVRPVINVYKSAIQ